MDQVALMPKTSAVTKQVSEKVFFLADKGSKVEISNVLENINIPAHVF